MIRQALLNFFFNNPVVVRGRIEHPGAAATETGHQHDWLETCILGDERIEDCSCGVRRAVKNGLTGKSERILTCEGGSFANAIFTVQQGSTF